MARSATPFLMFDGLAETAINFYVTLFQGSAVKHIERYGPGEQGKAGSVKRAECVIAGLNVMAIDSPIKHAFTFTPSVSCSCSARPRPSSMRRLAGSPTVGRC